MYAVQSSLKFPLIKKRDFSKTPAEKVELANAKRAHRYFKRENPDVYNEQRSESIGIIIKADVNWNARFGELKA
jgi:hypothetical protein